VRIVSEAEAFFWDANEVAVQLVVRILIMNYGEGIGARRNIIKGDGSRLR
jgi:hypothetical protein